MFKRFILDTDLSPASSALINCADSLRSLGGRHCLLLQCLDMQQAVSTAFSYSTDSLENVLLIPALRR
jgi:hypothetical protein